MGMVLICVLFDEMFWGSKCKLVSHAWIVGDWISAAAWSLDEGERASEQNLTQPTGSQRVTYVIGRGDFTGVDHPKKNTTQCKGRFRWGFGPVGCCHRNM